MKKGSNTLNKTHIYILVSMFICPTILIVWLIGRQQKQAKNGLQSRSFKNGKTEVWHYGLAWFGIIWFCFVLLV